MSCRPGQARAIIGCSRPLQRADAVIGYGSREHRFRYFLRRGYHVSTRSAHNVHAASSRIVEVRAPCSRDSRWTREPPGTSRSIRPICTSGARVLQQPGHERAIAHPAGEIADRLAGEEDPYLGFRSWPMTRPAAARRLPAHP